ncbi:MAG: alpha-ketoglutarate-dependent dioxygenase AlkB [Candidatus Nitrosopolaris sp.]
MNYYKSGFAKMNLFNQDRTNNILPKDGTVHYYPNVLTHDDANRYFDLLLQKIVWENDEVVIFGKHIVAKRKVAWYGDSDYLYTYSNTTKQALVWTKELLELKQIVEKPTETKFNSCLLNLYHSGNEGIGWHSDDEESLEPNSTIASLSLGAQRKFSFKHKQTKQTISLVLEHGSLLIMKDATQTYWLHTLLESKAISGPRINLTFRTMIS